MSYLINNTRLAKVKIGGVDVTDRVADISLSDSSGIKNGLIATDGEITLAYRPGSPDREDYRRNTFPRGAVVTIDIVFPSGNTRRHPRGYLKVIDSNFDPQNESIKLSVGCPMAVAALDGDIDAIKDLVSLYMPETREDYQSIASALATETKIAWYDGFGNLQSSLLWDGETQSSSPTGKWVSVFGVTAQAIAPLDNTRSIVAESDKVPGQPYSGGDPDNIELSFDEPAGDIDPATGLVDGDGEDNRVDIQESTASYFVQYPAIFYTRVPPEDQEEAENPLEDAGSPEEDKGLSDPRPSDCVEEVTETDNPADTADSGGDENGDTDCMSNYETIRTPLYVGVRSRSYGETHYEGPAGARDRSFNENYGPAIEVNSQYYGDVYQLCRQSWATRCAPNGYCSTSSGTQTVLISRSEFRVEFNPDGSVAREITEEYQPMLAAAVPDNWRAGVVDGKITGFRRIDNKLTQLYRSRAQIVEYEYPEIGTKRVTTSYESIASRGGGMPSSTSAADAYNGIKTTRTERSYSLGINAEAPPVLVQPEPATDSKISNIVFPKHDDLNKGSSTKGLVFKESIPYPILVRKGGPLTRKQVIADYEDYIKRCIKGSSLGLRIGEALREEIVEYWEPNQTFRYADPRYNTVISMRGDAHTWSMTPDQCVFSVDGLNVGFSNGTPNIPDNIVGAETAIL